MNDLERLTKEFDFSDCLLKKIKTQLVNTPAHFPAFNDLVDSYFKIVELCFNLCDYSSYMEGGAADEK